MIKQRGRGRGILASHNCVGDDKSIACTLNNGNSVRGIGRGVARKNLVNSAISKQDNNIHKPTIMADEPRSCSTTGDTITNNNAGFIKERNDVINTQQSSITPKEATSKSPNNNIKYDSNATTENSTTTADASTSSVFPGAKLLAKFSYQANVEQPGGFVEMSMKAQDTIFYLETHPAQPLWWKVRGSDSTIGYVPAKYCMLVEEKVDSLPWLEKKKKKDKEDKEREMKNMQIKTEQLSLGGEQRGFGAPLDCKPTHKAYIPSYSSSISESNSSAKKSEYYCELCDKELNGPTPYRMHMKSKNHREIEEEEAARRR